MNKVSAERPVVIRFCGRCGERLTQSNKSIPPRCYNTAACESRARKKQTISPSPPVKTLPTDKAIQIIMAVCGRFNFPVESLCGPAKEHKYGHARRVLCYLLIQDAKCTNEKAGAMVGGRTSSLAQYYKQEVVKNFESFKIDITTIRARCDEMAQTLSSAMAL